MSTLAALAPTNDYHNIIPLTFICNYAPFYSLVSPSIVITGLDGSVMVVVQEAVNAVPPDQVKRPYNYPRQYYQNQVWRIKPDTSWHRRPKKKNPGKEVNTIEKDGSDSDLGF